jgi:hypothetical protein
LVPSETSLSSVKTIRTVMVIAGLVIAYSSLLVTSDSVSLAMFIVGLGLVLWGCYLWAKLKGRSWAWMLLGFLAPAGLMGLLILPAKSQTVSPLPPPSPPRGVT